MTFDTIEALKKKILYKSYYRGSKEADFIIHNFINHQIKNSDKTLILLLDSFLDLSDEDIFKSLNGNYICHKTQTLQTILEQFKIFYSNSLR